MKMRFWQKTYIFTLVLFLLCMNIGILSLTVYTYQKNVETTETSVKAEQYYIATSFERDYEDLLEINSENASPTLLMQSFGSYYGEKGIYLAFSEGEKELYSDLPYDYEIGENRLIHTDFDEQRHILISSTVCDGKYTFVFAKNVQSLDDEFRSLMLTFVLTALAVSGILAIILYFILKKLSKPLEELRKTTESVISGDFNVTAEEKGDDEFTLLARSLNMMLAKINEQMNALELNAEKKQKLVDNLAHELRTPLTSIQGYAEFLEKASTSEEKRIVAAKYIMSESERLKKISEILLDSAYIRGNPPEMSEIDISTVLEDVTEKLKLKAEKREISLEFSPASLKMRGNETLLSMLFYNLIDNALKACKPKKKVTVSIDGSRVVVEDNGKGMTEEQLLHITEPFYRTDKSRSRAEGGAGLGLALCKQICETHGATLSFESKLAKGTKAFVDFTTSIQL